MKLTTFRGCGMALALAGSGCGEDSPKSPAEALDLSSTNDAAVAPDMRTDGPGAPDATTDGAVAPKARLESVPETERWDLPGLSGPAYVVRTEGGIPHIYASSRDDLGRVTGFVIGRDRYFFMELQRRLGTGRISELLGDRALGNDVTARLTGYAFVADRLEANLSPEMRSYLLAVVDGLNYYIDQVRSRRLPGPSELQLAGPFLGAADSATLMVPFTLRDLAAMASIPLFETNFRTDDLVRSLMSAQLEGAFTGEPSEALRRSGYEADIFRGLAPMFPGNASAPGFGTTGTPKASRGAAALRPSSLRPVSRALLERSVDRIRKAALLTHRYDGPHGSNAWAVAGDKTANGDVLVAGDGHLSLSVPSLMYQVGLDTEVLGGGDIHQRGLFLTPFPILGVGTNGDVAWGMVNPRMDITDWYREELQLDASGAPVASLFGGEFRPLVRVDETYVVADVPALMSRGRTEVLARYTTFDGRFLWDIEGRVLLTPEEALDGESPIHFGTHLVVPGDTDGDGVVSAVSFDHGGFDATKWVDALYNLGMSKDVMGYREASRGLVGGGLFSAAGDTKGNIFYTSYQAVPCRGYLPRQDGRFVEGANPNFLLDGTTYGAFELPSDAQGHAAEEAGAEDPYRCVIPFEAMPQSLNPATGFVVTANNQPAPIDDDADHTNDAYYLGGPWDSTRADSIRQGLEAATTDSEADIEDMAAVQAGIRSRAGERYAPHMVSAVDTVLAAVDAGPAGSAEQQRLAVLFAANVAELTAANTYLRGWTFDTPSGVETFYHSPREGELADAVATMIYNDWMPRFVDAVFGDESFNTLFPYDPPYQRTSVLLRFLEARLPGGPTISSVDPQTGESVFFDRIDTPALETADELIVRALVETIAALSAPNEVPGEGGFGTADMSQWLWGMRHQVRFESLLAGFLGDDPTFSLLINPFSITTAKVPLLAGLDRMDPRKALKWFPRGGDGFATDAADPEYGTYGFHYTHGPVMRMVIGLSEGRVTGQNIIPGGQSGITESPAFADQVRRWLGNETLPLRFHVDEVVEGAIGRETYGP
ncbi:MAG: penicillin acylase family protein [Myxococcales bacterium]|nr:penicillin acylase family protein [Myxococcales bacterium]